MSCRGKTLGLSTMGSLVLLQMCCSLLALTGPVPLDQTNHTQASPNKIRLALTRDINFDKGGQLRAPEVSYFTEIGVGAPAKMFKLAIDTSFDKIWLPGYNGMPFANNLHYSKGYSGSSTGRSLPKQIKFEYRGTILTGNVHQDVFNLYGMDRRDQKASGQVSYLQRYLTVNSASDEQFRSKPYDGVLGLRSTPVPDFGLAWKCFLLGSTDERDLYSSNPRGRRIDVCDYPNESVYALWFNPDQDSPNGGELMLGGVDESRFTGEISYHDCDTVIEWAVAVWSVHLGDKVVSCEKGCTATVDSGSNLMFGPIRDVAQIYAQLNANHWIDNGFWTVDCNRLDELPSLVFKIDETLYPISPRQYTRKFYHHDNPICQLLIEARYSSDWALGTSFLGAHYSVFDFKNRRVGLATPRA